MRFSIISYFNDETTNKIRSIQQKLFEITGSRGSLDIWEPHITVGAGVEISEDKIDLFKEQLSKIASTHKSFNLELKDYGFMDNWDLGKNEGFTSFVIYIDVVLNDDLLKLVEDIEKVTNDHPLFYGQLKSYAPHITIAFKDLDKQGFEKARSILSKENFSAISSINHIAISSEDENNRWTENQRFELKG